MATGGGGEEADRATGLGGALDGFPWQPAARGAWVVEPPANLVFGQQQPRRSYGIYTEPRRHGRDRAIYLANSQDLVPLGVLEGEQQKSSLPVDDQILGDACERTAQEGRRTKAGAFRPLVWRAQ
jgi:hypothetical protein